MEEWRCNSKAVPEEDPIQTARTQRRPKRRRRRQ
ncbi:TPA: hypothetical protein N0F65_011298 [Lagenidium giganteum]|uniref:Uncharacterized protein n=1 Tax=Lagenidium giganteum TaxID=4803 RepID=A0AAV2YW00_9STRA|nr:TPA: hypothetical protein N0F65_011298 [Lagenidium giganteum]